MVSEDEREGDLRRILNFGHTLGHALEAETCYVRFLHGEAVAFGMLAATRLATLLVCCHTVNAISFFARSNCMDPFRRSRELTRTLW